VINLSDERLCWLAVRDELDRRSRSSGKVFLVRLLTRSPRGGPTVSGDVISDQMREYAFAVDDLAAELNPAERQVLRATGQVPAWFLPSVEQRVKEAHRSR